MNLHLVLNAGPPTGAPPSAGIHWVDTLNRVNYISVGTSTVADWLNEDTRRLSTVSKTTNYDMTNSDYMVVVTGGGSADIKLPNPAQNEGKEFVVFCTDVTSVVRVIPYAAETLNGASVVIIETDYQGFTFRAFSGNWLVI